MNPALPDEAVEFGQAAVRAIGALGGVDAARRAEADPSERGGRVTAVLAELGAEEIVVDQDLAAAAAGAELCRVAGRAALPYPVPAFLLRGCDPSGGGRPVAVAVADAGRRVGSAGRALGTAGRRRVDHGDLFPEWTVVAPDGTWAGARPTGARLATRLGPFVTDLDADDPPAGTGGGGAAARLHLTLTAWTVLGVVERAVELAVEHVTTRIQFGQPLSAFQAVQFQLADAVVGVDGLREMCRFTLWRLFSDPERSLPDALAVRLHALDVARAVLRTTQQLHGAAGLCDEYDISILVRHVQPALRLPFGAERTADELFSAVADHGFASLFPHGADRDLIRR